MQLPHPLQRDFLIGLWRGDGCFDKTGSGIYTTASRLLATQVRQMLYRFGIVAGLTISRPHGRVDHMIGGKRVPFSHPLYGVKVSGVYAKQLNTLLGWTLDYPFPAHHLYDRIIDGYVHRRVKQVTFASYEGPVYNYEVDEDHTYQTESFLVHNCDASAGAHYGLTLGQTLLPDDFSIAPALQGMTQSGMEIRAQHAALLPQMAALWGVEDADAVA